MKLSSAFNTVNEHYAASVESIKSSAIQFVHDMEAIQALIYLSTTFNCFRENAVVIG